MWLLNEMEHQMTGTSAAGLVEKYLALGGQRKASADDNLISTRIWDDEPKDACEFRERNGASLSNDRREEKESLLSSISGDTP